MKQDAQKIKLSIVTISFNQAQYLTDCIESVLSQTNQFVEYIVVDPGSSDGSRDIIESYGDKIKPVFKSDKGPADGLNNGFNCANGEYFYFLNSDDVLLPGAIERFMKAIDENKQIDVFCFGGYLADENLDLIRPVRTFNYSAKRFCTGATSLFQQGVVFSAAEFRRVNGFDPYNRTCWDAKLLFDLSMNKCTFQDKEGKVALFRVYPGSITGSAQNLIENQKNKDEMFMECFARARNTVDKFLYNFRRFQKYFYLSYTVESITLYLKNRFKNVK